MLDPSKRFITVILALGVLALLAGIAVGERAGDRVIGQVTEKRLQSIAPVTVTPTPAPKETTAPYGPDWKRTDVMAAAPDPAFPDPRIPPEPLPTAAPTPKATPRPSVAPTATPTPNMNLPIWRRAAPLPTATPPGGASPTGSASPSGSPSPSESPSPQPGTNPLD